MRHAPISAASASACVPPSTAHCTGELGDSGCARLWRHVSTATVPPRSRREAHHRYTTKPKIVLALGLCARADVKVDHSCLDVLRAMLMLRNTECHLRLLAHSMMLLRVNRRAPFVVVDAELVPSVELAIRRVEQSATLSRRVTFMELAACA